uniref:Uncharacterized protein n=1 Tax=Fagus sylvatica TaxID=28930 RepID=A0A2N9FDL9_FAGSY
MLPPNYLDGARRDSQSLAVFKGSLALIVLGENLDGFDRFFCCTDSGELLIHTFERGVVSYDPESLNWNKLGILRPLWLSYTADLMENLVLLDQQKSKSKQKQKVPSQKSGNQSATRGQRELRGLNDKDKRLRMRNLFKLWKADVIYLRMRTQSMFLMCHGQEAC